MAGATFVRAQGPRCRREVEVVVGRICAGGGVTHRQHELSLLPGIANQLRAAEMRCRLRRAFSRGAQAHHHGPFGHVDDALAADDRVDGIDDLAIARFQLVIWNRVALQFADHFAIVIGWLQSLFFRYQWRKCLHGGTGFHELQLRTLDQFLRCDVDAHQLRRQDGVHPRYRQHAFTQP